MKDIDKILRKAVFDALDGNISVPVFDEVKKIGNTQTLFVILGGQRTKRDPTADGLWARRCTIEVIITQKTGSSVSKDDIDDVSNEILEILFPDYDTFGVSSPSGFQFANEDFETGTTNRLQLTPTESVIAKVLLISVNIIEQN